MKYTTYPLTDRKRSFVARISVQIFLQLFDLILYTIKCGTWRSSPQTLVYDFIIGSFSQPQVIEIIKTSVYVYNPNVFKPHS